MEGQLYIFPLVSSFTTQRFFLLALATVLLITSTANAQVIHYSSFEEVDLISQETVMATPSVEAPPGSGIDPDDVTVSSLFSDEAEAEVADTLLVGEINGDTLLLAFGSIGDLSPTLNVNSTVETLIVLMTGVGRRFPDGIPPNVETTPAEVLDHATGWLKHSDACR